MSLRPSSQLSGGRGRAARASAGLHGRRGLLAPFGARAPHPRSTGRAPRRFASLTVPIARRCECPPGAGSTQFRKQDRTHVRGLPVMQEIRGLDNRRGKWPTRASGGPAQERGKPRKCEAFRRAAEGIRTLDLLHGKQNVRSRAAQESPAKHGFPSYRRSAMLSSSYSEIAGVSGLKPDSGPCRFGRRLGSPTAGSRAGLCAHQVSATHRSAPTPRLVACRGAATGILGRAPAGRGARPGGGRADRGRRSKRDSASACVL